MDRFRGPQTALTIAFHGGLYLAIIMDRYGGPQTALSRALHGGLYLAIIMDRYRGPQNALTIALHGGFYFAIVIITTRRRTGSNLFLPVLTLFAALFPEVPCC
jgi:threonine/homoserine efflux transporter RhtA